MKKNNIFVVYLVSLFIVGFLLNHILIKIGVPDYVVWQSFASRGYKTPPKSYGFLLSLFLSLFLILQVEVYVRKFHPERRKNDMNPKQSMRLDLKSFCLIEIVALCALIPVFFIIKSILSYL